MPETTARLQRKNHIRQLAHRLASYASQITLDMAGDQPNVAHSQTAAEVAVELHAALSVLVALDEQAARGGQAATEKRVLSLR